MRTPGASSSGLTASSGGPDIAYLIVVDVTADPSEPDTSHLAATDVAAIDRSLEVAIRQEVTDQGSELVRWMSSHLNEARGQKDFVTAYIRKNSGKERQVIALRMTIRRQKMVFMGCFDAVEAQALALQIFNAMQQITILPPAS